MLVEFKNVEIFDLSALFRKIIQRKNFEDQLKVIENSLIYEDLTISEINKS